MVKNLPGNAGDLRDSGSIPGLERSTGGGNSNPLQSSCLENPMDRGGGGGGQKSDTTLGLNNKQDYVLLKPGLENFEPYFTSV